MKFTLAVSKLPLFNPYPNLTLILILPFPKIHPNTSFTLTPHSPYSLFHSGPKWTVFVISSRLKMKFWKCTFILIHLSLEFTLTRFLSKPKIHPNPYVTLTIILPLSVIILHPNFNSNITWTLFHPNPKFTRTLISTHMSNIVLRLWQWIWSNLSRLRRLWHTGQWNSGT